MQAAVASQLQELKTKSPNRRVGVICFNGDVTVLGDGSAAPKTFTGDLLTSYDGLFSAASQLSLSRYRSPFALFFASRHDTTLAAHNTTLTARNTTRHTSGR